MEIKAIDSRALCALNKGCFFFVSGWHQIANEEQFGKDLHQAAALIPQADVRIALVGDGAPWIWKHMTSAFPDGQEILDYYHCKEHIHKVANLQYIDDEAKRQTWIESTMGRLHFGEVESVRWGLQRMKPFGSEAAKEIEKLITYLGNNSHRIDYAAAKKRQFPCGSGGGDRVSQQGHMPHAAQTIGSMVD